MPKFSGITIAFPENGQMAEDGDSLMGRFFSLFHILYLFYGL